MKSYLLEFLQEHEIWEELIKEKPYCVDVKRDGEYTLFSYNQIESDFSNPVVQECRGIIIHEPSMKIVCFPFSKFFNVQQGEAATIDWSTAQVSEKKDGSLIKCWYHNGEWRVSTNGTVDADKTNLQFQSNGINTFLDLFLSAENLPEDFFESCLDTRFTYMFELTSPLNRVVVPYNKTEIWFIGCRNNKTFEEVDPADCDLEIQRPEVYSLKTIDECLKVCETLPFEKEGYVIRDSNFNRIKVKGVAYVASHHLKNNGVVTKSRIVDMFRANAQDDFLSIYGEYTDAFNEVGTGIENFLKNIRLEWHDVSGKTFETRKDLAMYVSKTTCPACMFSLSDKKFNTVEEWFWSQQNDKILSYIAIK